MSNKEKISRVFEEDSSIFLVRCRIFSVFIGGSSLDLERRCSSRKQAQTPTATVFHTISENDNIIRDVRRCWQTFTRQLGRGRGCVYTCSPLHKMIKVALYRTSIHLIGVDVYRFLYSESTEIRINLDYPIY